MTKLEEPKWFDEFCGYIQKEELLQKKIKFIKLTGSIEDYLVKEFTYWYCQKQSGCKDKKYHATVNHGNKNGRIDILCFSLEKGNYKCDCLIEAKYVTNILRDYYSNDVNISDKFAKKRLRSLKVQIERIKEVKLSPPLRIDHENAKEYGFIFAVFCSYEQNDLDKVGKGTSFFESIELFIKEQGLDSSQGVDIFQDNSIETPLGKRFMQMKIFLVKERI